MKFKIGHLYMCIINVKLKVIYRIYFSMKKMRRKKEKNGNKLHQKSLIANL